MTSPIAGFDDGAVRRRRPGTNAVGITVFGCDRDEAHAFNKLSRRFGVRPTITAAPASASSAVSASGNRCISVGHKSGIAGPTLRALKETGVEYISSRSRGLDHIDLDAAGILGITVENVTYAPDGVADYTLMLILMALRNAKAIVRAAEQHDYRLRTFRGRELRDLTVGVVGVGRIGSAVIGRMHGFGCRVLAHGRSRNVAPAEQVSLDELLLRSDIVTLHLPLNADTYHVIGRRQIDAMKRGAVLINTGRGALVDTAALIAGLESGHLAAAALDVLEGEEGVFYFDCTERPIDNGLLLTLQRMPNVIITPHTAYYTDRVLHDTVETTIVNCLKFERNRVGA